MFDILFGWRKASKCKKLIKGVQCRLKLLKNKRFAVAEQLREDIVQLLKYGHEQIAFKRLDYLYMDENMISLYDLLDQFSEFIILNLSYIRRHKDLPNDVNEAVSTLIFASARCGDLPELMLVRKLFGERYGQKFIISAVELYPGNLVNEQVKEKLIPHSTTESVKNKMLDEIVRAYFCKTGLLALEYKPDFQVQPKEVADFYVDEGGQDKCISTSFTSCSIMLQSSPPIMETPEQENVQSFALMSTPYEHEIGIVEVREEGECEKSDCSSECSTLDFEDSMTHLDDVQEFKSPTKQGTDFEEQDQRFFLFSLSPSDDSNLVRKRMRRSLSRKKQKIDNGYGYESSNRRKCQKKVRFEEEVGNYMLDQGCMKLDNNEENEVISSRDYMDSPLRTKCRALTPYVRAATMPERREVELKSTEIIRLNSMPVEKTPTEYNGSRNSASLKHVHPKLPDYDEITAKFKELKKVYQLNKCIKA